MTKEGATTAFNGIAESLSDAMKAWDQFVSHKSDGELYALAPPDFEGVQSVTISTKNNNEFLFQAKALKELFKMSAIFGSASNGIIIIRKSFTGKAIKISIEARPFKMRTGVAMLIKDLERIANEWEEPSDEKKSQ